jgi:hypothetical protein
VCNREITSWIKDNRGEGAVFLVFFREDHSAQYLNICFTPLIKYDSPVKMKRLFVRSIRVIAVEVKPLVVSCFWIGDKPEVLFKVLRDNSHHKHPCNSFDDLKVHQTT